MKLTPLYSCLLASALLSMSAAADEPTTAPSVAPVETMAPADAPAPAATVPATAAAAPSAPPSTLSKAVVDAIGTPPAGKALVVFFREHKFAGSAIRYKVREGETELGKLSSGTYFVAAVDPGQHTYVVHSEAKDITNIEAEAGETYFLIGTVTMGFMAGHPNLSPSDATAFEAALPKLKPSKPLDK